MVGFNEIKKRIKQNIRGCDYASANPIIVVTLGIFAAGGFYTLFFIYIAPSLYDLIPDSDFKIVILGLIFVTPGIIVIVGILAMIKEGMKDNPSWNQGGGNVL